MTRTQPVSLAVFSCDMFCSSEGRLASSPIVSSSIRLFADNFDKVQIVAHQSGEAFDAQKHVVWPAKYSLRPVPEVRGIRKRPSQAWRVLKAAYECFRACDFVYLRLVSYEALPAAIYGAVLHPARCFVSLHGDIEEAIAFSDPQKNRFFSWGVAKVIGFLTRRICARVKALFTSGPALGSKYAPQRTDAACFMDSGIREEDVYSDRVDTCDKVPYQLVYVGEMTRRKGIDVLLSALAALKEANVEVRLLLFGGGDVSRVRSLATKLGVGDWVVFKGYVKYGKELFEAIRAGDILVAPSRGSEGWNRTITEANAQGLPIVASDVDSLGVAVTEWSCGLTVPPDDPRKLAEAIRRIGSSPEERRAMVRKSLERGRHYVYAKEFARIRAQLEKRFGAGLLVSMEEIDVDDAGRKELHQ